MLRENMLPYKKAKTRTLLRFALFTTLLFSVLVVSATGEAAEAKKIMEIGDEGILAAIEYRMLVDRTVFSNDIDLMVMDGVVTLSGSVDNLLSRDRVVSIARAVRGVRSVVDLFARKLN